MRHVQAGMAASFILLAGSVGAQTILRGTVRSAEGAPVPGANVFVIETLEGGLTDTLGRFGFPVSAPRPFTVLTKRIGFAEVRREVTAKDSEAIAIVLERATTTLAPITVQAGAYTAGEQRGATLTPLEVVTTPGTAADINRTIQLLPGVQSVDDGTALFVRGGDYTETKVFLNDAPILNPAQFLTPTGTFVGTVDPFQLDGIFFSSGGFGARYGNALSGVVGLNTKGSAAKHAASLGAGLAATSIDAAVAAGPRLTFRVAGNRTDLSPFFRVNNNARDFSPVPHGHDASASATYTWGVSGEVKAFVLDQTNLVGAPLDEPGFQGRFDIDIGSRLTVLSVKDVVGGVSVRSSLSEGTLERRETFGNFVLGADQRQRQLFAEALWQPRNTGSIRAGIEVERLTSTIGGRLTGNEPRQVFSLDGPGRRTAMFLEHTAEPSDKLKFVLGMRADHASLTGNTSIDPRVSVAMRLVSSAVLTAAWGVYHQIPDPLFYSPDVGRPGLPSMRARQWIVGLQTGDPTTVLFRAEAYAKTYAELSLPDREYKVRSGGRGTSRGVDLFLKSALGGGLTSRTAVSYLVSKRTDPDDGTLARAPFDVTWSSSVVLEKTFPSGFRAGANWRNATGRPFTPIDGATFDAARDLYVPNYGSAMSDRFPNIKRLDVSLSRYKPITPHLQSVVYLSASNIFDSPNTQGWRYSRDYSTRTPLPSIFNRSVYFGATLIFQ